MLYPLPWTLEGHLSEDHSAFDFLLLFSGIKNIVNIRGLEELSEE
jgi:hypothetical protein